MLNIWKETLNGRVGARSSPVLNICFQECDFQELIPVINDCVSMLRTGISLAVELLCVWSCGGVFKWFKAWVKTVKKTSLEGTCLNCCCNGVMEGGGAMGTILAKSALWELWQEPQRWAEREGTWREISRPWKAVDVKDCWAQLPVALSPCATCVHSLLSLELCSQSLLGMPQLKLWLLPSPVGGWAGCFLIPEQLTVTLLRSAVSGDSKGETFQLCWLKISLLTHCQSMAGEMGAWPCKAASCCPRNTASQH